MDNYQSLNHSKWDCKYHVVFIPKYRRKALYAELRRHSVGDLPDAYAAEGKCRRGRTPDVRSRAHADLDPAEIFGGASGRVHQGKSAIHIARTFMERKRNFRRAALLGARLLYVSTVGRDEEVIRKYIRDQEVEDKRVDQLNLV